MVMILPKAVIGAKPPNLEGFFARTHDLAVSREGLQSAQP
jgi:hypothetical protein